MSAFESGETSAALLAFLDDPGPAAAVDPARPPLAEQALQFAVDERGPRSRFVTSGGVRFNHAATYWLTVGDLEPMAERREALTKVRLVLVKFTFTFLEPPRNHRYEEIRVRIDLKPQIPVMQLRPRQKNTQAQTTRSFSSEFAPTVAKMVQIAAKHTTSKSTSMTEEQPVVTALDLGHEGFGWTYQASHGLPLGHGIQHTTALLEVPRDTTALVGTFDSEAIVARRLLRAVERCHALPIVPAAPFSVDL